VLIADDTLVLLTVALVIDAMFGDPEWLWARVPHPVAMIGGVIDHLDDRLNDTSWSPARRRTAGISAIAVVTAGAARLGWLAGRLVHWIPSGWVLEALVASIFLAQRLRLLIAACGLQLVLCAALAVFL